MGYRHLPFLSMMNMHIHSGVGNYRDRFDTVISSTIRKALRLASKDPNLALSGGRILYRQRKAAAVRKGFEREGILVPAVMMISLTSRCNLACTGCYMRAQARDRAPDMTPEQLRTLVGEAEEMGISVIVFAGGEPLLRSTEIFALADQHPHLLFAFFSNGLLIDAAMAASIACRKNLVPVISFEGFQAETDRRRGCGVYERLLSTTALLQERKVFYGCSITVTRRNMEQVLDDAFVHKMLEAGARAFVFVEYVPIEPGTEDLVLTDTQRTALNTTLSSFDRKYPALFIGFPGEEEAYGGCLAAGRGFVHISAAGDLEPCPGAPFSDANITRIPLRDAICSGLLERIRQHHHLLTETKGGCALWANREWVRNTLKIPEKSSSEEQSPGEK
jgi:MoaA/NifB/PqqE/SkfB family radical SAM enzyme